MIYDTVLDGFQEVYFYLLTCKYMKWFLCYHGYHNISYSVLVRYVVQRSGECPYFVGSRKAVSVVLHVSDLRQSVTCYHPMRSCTNADGEGVGGVYCGYIQWDKTSIYADMSPWSHAYKTRKPLRTATCPGYGR